MPDEEKHSPEAAVFALLASKGITFASAESCTGGLIAKRITDVPGASAVFRGGVVSYCNEVKHDVLGVDENALEEYGAVSEPVAREMAEGARRKLGADLAVSTTGVAGPAADDRGNPVGTVYVALAAERGSFCRLLSGGTEREAIRNAAADCAFNMIAEYLSEELR